MRSGEEREEGEEEGAGVREPEEGAEMRAQSRRRTGRKKNRRHRDGEEEIVLNEKKGRSKRFFSG